MTKYFANPQSQKSDWEQDMEDVLDGDDSGWDYQVADPMAFKSPFANKTLILTPIMGDKHEISSTQVVDRLVETGALVRNTIDEVHKISGQFRIGCVSKLAEDC